MRFVSVSWLACLVLVAGCTSGPRSYQIGRAGSPFGGLEHLKDFETRRESSCQPEWRNTNRDSVPIAPGETVVLADLAGPGKIVHIWLTTAHADPFHASKLTLRMYWDGESHPSVECPLGDFFAVGFGMSRPFASFPIRVIAEGRARNCYWPMPFRKSARITITNESDLPCRSLYYYVDWQKHRSIPKDAAYFHAMYRQEFPCVMGRNYQIADIQGRGHYVGTVQSVYHTSAGWYGEGDDFFFIDGAEEPQLRGTGTEDYFCDAWGFREHDSLFFGVPVCEGRRAGDRVTAYRFHIPDPVVFKKSLWVEIEHKGDQAFPRGPSDPFIERDDMMSSVAFWYQTEPHKPWPQLPPGNDRLPFELRKVVRGVDAIDSVRGSDHPMQQQSTRGRQHLWFKPDTQEAWLEIPFELTAPIEADLVLAMTHAPDYGKYRVYLNGKDAGLVDLFALYVTPGEHILGRQKLAAGKHVLRLECVGKSESSRGYFLGFEHLEARVPRYLRPEGKTLRDLQVPPTK